MSLNGIGHRRVQGAACWAIQGKAEGNATWLGCVFQVLLRVGFLPVDFATADECRAVRTPPAPRYMTTPTLKKPINDATATTRATAPVPRCTCGLSMLPASAFLPFTASVRGLVGNNVACSPTPAMMPVGLKAGDCGPGLHGRVGCRRGLA